MSTTSAWEDDLEPMAVPRNTDLMKHLCGPAILRLGFLVLLVAPSLRAQAPESADVRRAQASRQYLESALVALDQVASSPGYSSRLRKANEAEAKMVRLRLTDGDFQVGDQIDLSVTGEPTLTGKFTVLPDRTLPLPNLPPISLKGILRSEASGYLAKEIGRFLRQPQVQVQAAYIRLAILGAVRSPGYYTVPADLPISDAIMLAGGPAPGVELAKTLVKRNDREAVGRDQVRAAVAGGLSLDQLNLHGGDELVVGGSIKSGGGSQFGPLGAVGMLLPLVYLVLRVGRTF